VAVVYNTTLKNARLQLVVTAIDAGSGAGTLEIGTAGMGTVLAAITLSDPCGSVSGGVLTFTVPVSDNAANASGTAAEARIKDSDGNVVVSGLTVGTSGTNVVLNSTDISINQQVTITSATITHG
jgi:hypothetical protein